MLAIPAGNHRCRRDDSGSAATITGASAASALAPSIGVLIAARAVQGVGAAIVTPLTVTLIASVTRRSAAACHL